ncbi:MAG: tetratricopeptide repeat protein [Nitrospirae bacterium]|nr:tetratricopeptide repeat protein [Nitrospirota bacterium]
MYENALEKYRQEKFHEAIEILTKITSKNAGDYNLLGWAFLKVNDPDNAIQNFQLSISLNPISNDSYCGLGYAYIQQESFTDALENFQKYLSQNPKNIDCLTGLGLTFEKLNDTQKAAKIFREIVAIDKQNLFAQQKIEVLSLNERSNEINKGSKFFAKGNYFWVRDDTGKIAPLFIKGVNIGTALPGKFPSEFPEDENLYHEWFNLIGEMNANVIRIYTILPPQFYIALKKYNKSRKDRERLYLIQGIWAELPEKFNFDDTNYLKEINQELQNAVNVIHGNVSIPHRYGHAFGTYFADVSEYVLGFIFGREWEPYAVAEYNNHAQAKNYSGKFLSINNGNPMEVWLTKMLDYLIAFETDSYQTQRPVAFMNWPTLDPLHHITEATYMEEVQLRKKLGEIIEEKDHMRIAYDDDANDLDETKIIAHMNFGAGIFASYHVYPYYPDFLRYEKKYGGASISKGSNYYHNYLVDLKNYYKNIPLLISEFGIPTSRGIARFHPEGLNHGGHNEDEQADIIDKMIFSIRESQCAGGIIFSWIDEWVKTNWMVKGTEERDQFWFNAQDPEESYGLIAQIPAKTEILTGNPSSWNNATLLYSKNTKNPARPFHDGYDDARNLKHVLADYDAGYLYLRIDIAGPIDWEKVAYLIGIDTYGDKEGDHRLPFNLNLDVPIGCEFTILLHGNNSKILIDDRYNKVVYDPNLLRLSGMSGYRENKNFILIPNDNGIFTDIIITHRRKFSRDGNIFPEKIYNASILKHGNLRDDTLSDFYYSKTNNFIEIRIPWNLLNFSDPSHLQIIYSKGESRITKGIRVFVVSYKPLSKDDSTAVVSKNNSNFTDLLPDNFADIKYFNWQPWEVPGYFTKPKKSYYRVKEIYGKIETHKQTLHIPEEFDFKSIVKNHYNSLEDFVKLIEDEHFVNGDPYGLALSYLVRGLTTENSFSILQAKSLFKLHESLTLQQREKEISRSGADYTENILFRGINTSTVTEIPIKPVSIEKRRPIDTINISKIIIGKSAIKLKKNSIIKTQVDRVVRDWLSAYNKDTAPWDFLIEKIVPWHEGEKIKEIVDLIGDIQVYPVWGTIVRKIGRTWYAPDGEGNYRFMLSDDKVYNYPTNIIIDDRTVLINDTHGINAIAWNSLDADLVIGCGDHEGKIDAAYYLANKGINVYMPTDRYIGNLIGIKTKGTIIGSAPIKKLKDGVIIGDQPIVIDINEPIVVSNSFEGYPVQYYDTPLRYFKGLENFLGRSLKIFKVEIKESGKANLIIDEARKIGAKVVGVRVWNKEEHDAVYLWLKEDKSRRAILFHSAVYPEGYRLFFEFPEQTSFGDINIDYEN